MKKFLLLLMILSFPHSWVKAQTLPRLNTPPLQPPPDIQPLPPLEEILPPTPNVTPVEPSPLPDFGGEITVREFKVEGSTIFSMEELGKIFQPYLNTPLTFNQLLESAFLITRLYQEKGYITSGAFIPAQTITDGIVVIQVIEGAIASIEIEGLNRLSPDYIRSRVELATNPPLNQERLLEALQLLQVTPLIASINAQLQPTTEVGKSILSLNVTEANHFDFLASYDNYRNPSVGTNRILAQLTHNNLLGRGDRFNVTYYHTDGSDSLDDLSYTLPINARNGEISFNFRASGSKVINPPIFEPFDLVSEYRKYELVYRQPIIQSASEELALGISTDWQTTANFLLGEPFPLSRGADEDGKTRVYALRFFQEYTKRTPNQVFLVRSQLNFGLSAFGATDYNDSRPDGQFITWRGQAQYLNALTSDVLLLLRSDLQLANRQLLPIEQFSIGGVYTVRGYSQDALLADNGFFASAELRANILKIPEWNTVLQITPFFDIGTVWNSDNFPLPKKTLYSTGLGLRLLINNIFSARLDWGIPSVDLDDNSNTLQSDGIYFSFELTPFR